MIRGSGPRPDPESFAFFCFDEFFDGSGPKDPDPGSRHTQQLWKNFKHDFLEEMGFCFTPFFHDLKALKLKKSQR